MSQDEDRPRRRRKLEKALSGRRGIARGLSRDIIVEAAKTLIAEHGTAAFRVVDLARVLEVQPPAIYNFFENREALLAEVSNVVGHQLYMVGEDLAGSPTERLAQLVRNMTELMHRDPSVARLQLEDVATAQLADRGEGRATLAAGRARLARLIDDGVKAGEFAPVSLPVMRALILGGLPAAMCWSRYDPEEGGEPDLEQLQNELVDSVLRQVAVRPS